MAPMLFKAALVTIALVLAVSGLLDLTLWLHGQETISGWLRLHPEWFVWSVFATLVFLLGLSMHLHLFSN